MAQPTAKLFTGSTIPLVGLGTWKSKPGQVASAIKEAIAAGYRHIDCAAVYGNEPEIGEGLKEALAANNLKREDVFITSKLWNTKHTAEDVKPALQKTLKDLQLDYLDLYLIHWPMGFERGDEMFPRNPDGSVRWSDISFMEAWPALETCVDEGLCRHIGLSNFNSKQIDEVMSKARIQPAVLQCESHPYLTQKELIAHAANHKIVFEAYSPLGSPDRPWAKPGEPSILEDPKIADIAKKYGKTTAQVLIRYQVERGVVVLPKSVTPSRIRENFDILDFSLSPEDMAVLDSFNRNWRCCIPTIEVNGEVVPRDREHPFFPFNISF